MSAGSSEPVELKRSGAESLQRAAAELAAGRIDEATRQLEKARLRFLRDQDVDGIRTVLERAQALPDSKGRERLRYAARQNVRYLSRAARAAALRADASPASLHRRRIVRVSAWCGGLAVAFVATWWVDVLAAFVHEGLCTGPEETSWGAAALVGVVLWLLSGVAAWSLGQRFGLSRLFLCCVGIYAVGLIVLWLLAPTIWGTATTC